MSFSYLLSLIILAVSIVVLIVIGILAKKMVNPTLTNIKKTQSLVNDHIEHFTNEANAIQTKIDHIVERVDHLQTDTETKLEHFEELSAHATHLGDAITHLNDQRTFIVKGLTKNTYEELKSDGPKVMKLFRLAAKRTYQKQKSRHTQS